MAKIKRIGGYNMAKSAKPIFVPGTNMQFASASAAAKALGINAGNIYSVLAGRRQTAGGYQFGYTFNRTIYIPETGRTFSDIKSAAQSVKVSPKKAVKGLEGRTGSAIGGYHFTYADASRISPPSSVGTAEAVPARSQKQNRRTKKQERIKQQRTKQQQRKERQRRKAREQSRQKPTQKQIEYTEAQRKSQRERAEYKRNKRQADKITSSIDELKRLLSRVNDQLSKYYDESMMGYSRAAQDVAEFQNYLGGTENGLFDLSESNLESLTETYTPEEIMQWKMQIEDEIKNKAGKFWDLKAQLEEREHYATQFNIPIGQLDDIADLLPDLWDVLALANTKQSKGSKLDGTWDSIKDAVQGTVTRDAMQKLIDNLKKFWNGDRSRQLKEILDDLNQYKANASPLTLSDDELPF